MYMRLVYARFKPKSVSKIREIYRESIIPELQNTSGCLYIGLLRDERQEDEGISMTLWDSYASVQAYEASGIYERLLAQMQPYLSAAMDYRINISDNLELEYNALEERPKVASYAPLAKKNEDIISHEEHPLLLMRIISIKIQPGKMEEFRRVYSEEIIPALREVQGCRNALLSDNIEESNEVLSVTVWENKQDLDNYIQSGIYKQLTKKLSPLYSDLYHLKLEHRKDSGGILVTSEDIRAKLYSIVIDKVFREER
jgi:quinol monooxygenase YgiN